MSDQPEMKVYPNGKKEWRLNGKLHRTDGPAIEWTGGSKEWRLNGKLHRTDGPAVEMADGSKMWFLDGEQVSWQEVFKQAKTEEIELRILSYVDDLLT